MNKKVKLLTFDTGSATQISLIRNVGECNVSTTLLTNEESKTINKLSKYVRKVIKVANWNVYEKQFIDDLISIGKEYPKEYLIIATADSINLLICKNYELLKDYFYFSFNSPEKEELLINKNEFYNKMEEVNVEIPTTYYLKSNEQLESIINTEGFPIIIKPYNMFDNEFHRLFNNKVLKIFNDKEYNMYKEKIKSIFSKVIVQPMIQGENIAIYGYFKDDRFISWCGCKKDYMSSWGTTVIGHSIMNNDLYIYSKDILSKIGYEGFAELEFIYDTKNKRYVILEINSRPVQWCRLCNKVTKPIEIIPFEIINKCKFRQTYDIKENINIYYETGLVELYDTNKIEFKDIFKYIFNSQSISMFMDIKDMKPSIRYLLTFIKSLIKSIIK